MSHINIEIKARYFLHNHAKDELRLRDAKYLGLDHQVDTYFKVPQGRLKLRQGNIENALVYYIREDIKGPKKSDVLLYNLPKKGTKILKQILSNVLETLVVVDKNREIYIKDNLKFHLDSVKGLGEFIEIEAIDKESNIPQEDILKDVNYYLDLFQVKKDDLIEGSYSDMLVQKHKR